MYVSQYEFRIILSICSTQYIKPRGTKVIDVQHSQETI